VNEIQVEADKLYNKINRIADMEKEKIEKDDETSPT
jgi:hypothetical protein